MALPRSHDASGTPVSGLGFVTNVPDPLQRRLRAHSRASKYRFRYSGDEDNPARCSIEGIPDLPHPDRQG